MIQIIKNTSEVSKPRYRAQNRKSCAIATNRSVRFRIRLEVYRMSSSEQFLQFCPSYDSLLVKLPDKSDSARSSLMSQPFWQHSLIIAGACALAPCHCSPPPLPLLSPSTLFISKSSENCVFQVMFVIITFSFVLIIVLYCRILQFPIRLFDLKE